MKFNPDTVIIRPGHCTRTWQSCDYLTADGVLLFHERSYMRSRPESHRPTTPGESVWLAGGRNDTSQWIYGTGTRAEIESLARKHGGRAMEEFYAPEGADAYFLAFSDNDRAVAFCQTKDFDRLSLTCAVL